jgi:predicted RNA binding protein YcfA (HicA-like mRNA interferase family)
LKKHLEYNHTGHAQLGKKWVMASLNPELRGIKAADAIKAFERAGGIRRSGKGDHVNIKMPNGRIITLRNKGEVKVGRLKDAIREAGLTAEQFLKLL